MEPLHVAVDTAEYCLFHKYDWWWFCLEKGEWASWVQAIGALIAIIFTIGQIIIASRSAKKQREEKRAVVNAQISHLEKRSAQTIYDLVWQIQASNQASRMLISDPENSRLLDVLQLSKAIQLQDLPDPENVTRVLEVLRVTEEVRNIYVRQRALLKDETDQLSPDELSNFKLYLQPYINAAAKVPGVQT